MPGPVSDAYDPEFGTSGNCNMIREQLADVYDVLTFVLGDKPPLYIIDLCESDLPAPVVFTLTEKQVRLLRFSLERAIDSI